MSICDLSEDEANDILDPSTFTYVFKNGAWSTQHKVDPVKAALVVSIPGAIYAASEADVHYFYEPAEAFKRRVAGPLSTCFSAPRQYFFRPYESGASAIDGFVSGLFMPGLSILNPIAAVGVCIGALIELVLGFAFATNALVHLIKGETEQAKRYAWDGLSRLLLSPVLALVSILSMPVELVRFFTRSVSTFIEFMKNVMTAQPDYPPTPNKAFS